MGVPSCQEYLELDCPHPLALSPGLHILSLLQCCTGPSRSSSPPHHGFIVRWWFILHATACWEIWKARCSLVMKHKHINNITLCGIIWSSLKAHIRAEWDPFKLKIILGKLIHVEAKNAFQFFFG